VQNIDCSQDKNGAATAVVTPGNHKYLSVILRFARNNTDARTDGNGATVYFNSDESFVIEVEQFSEGAAPALPTPPSDGILLCNVQLHQGDTTIANADIDTTNRHTYEGPPVVSSGWSELAPTNDTMQSTFDAIDAKLISRDGSGDIDQTLLPDGTTRDLGSAAKKWGSLHTEDVTLYNATVAGAVQMSAAKQVTRYESLETVWPYEDGSASTVNDQPDWIVIFANPYTHAARNVYGITTNQYNGEECVLPLRELIHGATLQSVRATWYQKITATTSEASIGMFKVANTGVRTQVFAPVDIAGFGAWQDDQVLASSMGEVIDKSSYRYFLRIINGTHGSSAIDPFIAAISHIQDVTDLGKAVAG